nr:MAG TPA: hypothetical protein [Caudoviricetes sp.]
MFRPIGDRLSPIAESLLRDRDRHMVFNMACQLSTIRQVFNMPQGGLSVEPSSPGPAA